MEPLRSAAVADPEAGPYDTGGVATPGGRPAGEAPARPRYWVAARLAAIVLGEFQAGLAAGRPAEVRERFYVLARYFRRTLAILHKAVDDRDEPLVDACLRNVLVLQQTLDAMHRAAPDAAPTTLALEPALHRRVNRDLVHRVLREAPHPIGAAAVLARFNELDAIGDARPPAIAAALRALVALGQAEEHDGAFAPGPLAYVDVNAERAALVMLVGPRLGETLADDGFEGLSDALDRPDLFVARLAAETGFSARTARLVLDCAAAIEGPVHGIAPARWPHADLALSSWPRPYQRMLQGILRARGYAGQLIEAPNGSGKTMIGMLCIDDWLGELPPGQSILVLVPTVNYEQQWLGELCLKPVGLRLPPHQVYAGAPAGLWRLLRSGADAPAVVVTTYPALARMVSGLGGDGIDEGALERFLQGAGVRHVILDEVHKVAADPASPTAACVRVLLDWLHDGSLEGVIGFSATLLELLPELAALGLELAYVLPPATLIGQGWVAPFAELGVPFSYSEREWRIVETLDRYRERLLAYLRWLGGRRLRAAFAAIPMDERVRIGLALGMYGDRPDRAALVRARLSGWEAGEDLGLAEVALVAILQLASGWSDADLMANIADPADTAEPSGTAAWAGGFDALRTELRGLLPPGRARRRLDAGGFGSTLDVRGLAPEADRSAVRSRRAKDALASTFAGLYLGLREWARQAGEGRVDAVRTIIEAERATRPVTGVIVFDDPAPLDWREGAAPPGYRGAGGLYLQLLADPASTPMAALATELYLPDRLGPTGRALHEEVGAWIVREMVVREMGGVLLSLLSAGSALGEAGSERLRAAVNDAMEGYAATLLDPGSDRSAVFDHRVLGPLRELRRSARRGSPLEAALARIRLEVREPHLRGIARSVFDYARIARAFRDAALVTATRGDGLACSLRVVPMPGGDRRQRMYDLVGRMVDTRDLPVDVVVVTAWARTGWNVTTPNVLIDATATRDVVAWQQLRGRSMRPMPTWTIEDQRTMQRLLADGRGGREGRERAAAAVMLERNKVAHVYELVRGHGSVPQVIRDRGGAWERTDAIAAKHRREWSVRSVDGAYLAGPGHAPLMVAEDPRRDPPAALRERLLRELAAGDAPTVVGWLRAAAAEDVAAQAADRVAEGPAPDVPAPEGSAPEGSAPEAPGLVPEGSAR